METFTGKLSTDPERQDVRWHFSLYNEETHKQISCMSSSLFEAENQNVKLHLKPCEVIRLHGHRRFPSQFWFDRLETRQKSA